MSTVMDFLKTMNFCVEGGETVAESIDFIIMFFTFDVKS